jgi:hypothetical protein
MKTYLERMAENTSPATAEIVKDVKEATDAYLVGRDINDVKTAKIALLMLFEVISRIEPEYQLHAIMVTENITASSFELLKIHLAEEFGLI